MINSKKRVLIVLSLALCVVGIFLIPHPPMTREQRITERLRQAGLKPDDAGRFVLYDPTHSGLALAFDPNHHDWSTGFRQFFGGIDECIERTRDVDGCFRAAPRCATATPWNRDPAGESCCPESCFREYFELRKTFSAAVAVTKLVDGRCYPGSPGRR